MSKMKGGFTLIEVSLFLAITGLLFLGVTVGVQNSIYQQRYNDAVQNFADFLGNLYSETMNVQNVGSGNSETAIYGRLAVFGEATGNENEIYAYDVVGQAKNAGTGAALEALNAAEADVVVKDSGALTGLIEKYNPKWGTKIEDANGGIFKGAVLIARHPGGGMVFTYVHDGDELNAINAMARDEGSLEFGKLLERLNVDNFGIRDIVFCIAPDGGRAIKRAVKIEQDSHNASGVMVLNDEESRANCGRS